MLKLIFGFALHALTSTNQKKMISVVFSFNSLALWWAPGRPSCKIQYSTWYQTKNMVALLPDRGAAYYPKNSYCLV